MDKYLKQLGEGWSYTGQDTYEWHRIDGHGLRVVRAQPPEKGWVCVALDHGQPYTGQYFPSFRQMLHQING